MNIHKLEAIDSHSHLNSNSSSNVPQSEIYTADLKELHRINKAANINKMVCSTFASVLKPECIVSENEYMYELSKQYDWLYQWVVIDPRIDDTFKQADMMVRDGRCVGLKLHPLYHKYSLQEYSDKIFSFAAQYDFIVLIHPNVENLAGYVDIADKYPNVKLIIAHLGGTGFVEAIKNARYKNIYTDTSGIASSNNKVIEYAVNQAGSEHILFGTDTYAAGFQRGRIEYALISDEDKANILRFNAERLFSL